MRYERMLRLLTSPLVALIIVVPLFLLAALRKGVQGAQQRGWLPGDSQASKPGIEVWARRPPRNFMR
jgi:hypothetical protein